MRLIGNILWFIITGIMDWTDMVADRIAVVHYDDWHSGGNPVF